MHNQKYKIYFTNFYLKINIALWFESLKNIKISLKSIEDRICFFEKFNLCLAQLIFLVSLKILD